MGGWVGGWVVCGWFEWIEENEAVRMSYCELGLGGWVGGWVGERWSLMREERARDQELKERWVGGWWVGGWFVGGWMDLGGWGGVGGWGVQSIEEGSSLVTHASPPIFHSHSIHPPTHPLSLFPSAAQERFGGGPPGVGEP